MMIRKDVLDKIGLMDERFYMYCEDVDLCYRIKNNGWKNFYLPEAKIVHYSGISTRRVKYRSIINHHKSMVVFYKKHFKRSLILDIFIVSGIISRAAICLIKATLFKSKAK